LPHRTTRRFWRHTEPYMLTVTAQIGEHQRKNCWTLNHARYPSEARLAIWRRPPYFYRVRREAPSFYHWPPVPAARLWSSVYDYGGGPRTSTEYGGGPQAFTIGPCKWQPRASLPPLAVMPPLVQNASSILAGATRAREGVGAAALAAGLAYLQTRKRIGCQHSGIPNTMTHGVREAGRLSPSDAGSRRAPPPLFARTCYCSCCRSPRRGSRRSGRTRSSGCLRTRTRATPASARAPWGRAHAGRGGGRTTGRT
jgi:hypothetical protein